MRKIVKEELRLQQAAVDASAGLERSKLELRQTRVSERLTRFEDLYLDGGLSKARYVERRDALEAEAAEVTTKLTERPSFVAPDTDALFGIADVLDGTPPDYDDGERSRTKSWTASSSVRESRSSGSQSGDRFSPFRRSVHEPGRAEDGTWPRRPQPRAGAMLRLRDGGLDLLRQAASVTPLLDFAVCRGAEGTNTGNRTLKLGNACGP